MSIFCFYIYALNCKYIHELRPENKFDYFVKEAVKADVIHSYYLISQRCYRNKSSVIYFFIWTFTWITCWLLVAWCLFRTRHQPICIHHDGVRCLTNIYNVSYLCLKKALWLQCLMRCSKQNVYGHFRFYDTPIIMLCISGMSINGLSWKIMHLIQLISLIWNHSFVYLMYKMYWEMFGLIEWTTLPCDSYVMQQPWSQCIYSETCL